MKVDFCICGRVATYGVIYLFKDAFRDDSYCDGCWHRHQRGKENMKPTHVRLKTGKKVYVERHEGGVIVVKGKNGQIHGSYMRTEMTKFYKRYKSLVAKKQTG